MEESFKARVDKVFGTLAAGADAQRLESLWSLTDEEIERNEWNRAKKPTQPDPDQLGLLPSSRRSRLEDEDDDDEDDVGAVVPSSILDAKPDDHDEEEWLIRSSVGMDTTLDKEEEEDEYDQIAVGIDKAGDEICMDHIDQYADALEEASGDVDSNLVGEFESFIAPGDMEVMIESGKTASVLVDDQVGVKSILKKEERNVQMKSLKRVRFDSESGSGVELEEKGVDRSVKFAAGSEVEGRVSFPPAGTDPRVPDYLRNPSKYTQYTLDSASELTDEEANRKAYMDFFNLIRKKRDNELQPAEDMSDCSKPLTFIPRKKTGDDDLMDLGESVKRGSHNENAQRKVGSSVVIAAADEVCAMEEDETEITPVNIPRKAQRQYRAKATATLEPLDD